MDVENWSNCYPTRIRTRFFITFLSSWKALVRTSGLMDGFQTKTAFAIVIAPGNGTGNNILVKLESLGEKIRIDRPGSEPNTAFAMMITPGFWLLKPANATALVFCFPHRFLVLVSPLSRRRFLLLLLILFFFRDEEDRLELLGDCNSVCLLLQNLARELGIETHSTYLKRCSRLCSLLNRFDEGASLRILLPHFYGQR
ncbi:hypothetical protein DITRI_Ditri06bG0138900 [Diplodiscus trichospermus]